MAFWRDISPKRATKDFASAWSNQDTRLRWRVLGVSIALTAGIMILLIPKSERIEPRAPDVFFITTFAPGRSDAEIERSNIENQKRKDALAAELARREEIRKEMYRELGRATGVDVDTMEREIAAQEAADKAAKRPASSAAPAPSPSPAARE